MKSINQPRNLLVCAGILVAGLLPLLMMFQPRFAALPMTSGQGDMPVRSPAPFEQWLVVITAFGVKPMYMLLTLIWILWLWRRRASDLAALRWGLIWFLAGETACAINYLFFAGLSDLIDYLHSFGMAVSFSFVAYAVLEGMDARFIKYSAPKDRCAALGLCRSCIKYADVPCGLRRLFTALIPALIVTALMLPCASVKATACRVCILGSVQDYSSAGWLQLFENRYCPWLAIALLAVSWLVLLFKRVDPVPTAKVFFAAALGPLGFGFMRLFLRGVYAEDLVWSNIWEELTELIFALAVGVVLWVFRESLFREERMNYEG
jgi:hypothetical protein